MHSHPFCNGGAEPELNIQDANIQDARLGQTAVLVQHRRPHICWFNCISNTDFAAMCPANADVSQHRLEPKMKQPENIIFGNKNMN